MDGRDRNDRHKGEPWVNWQWNNGARDDTQESRGEARDSRSVGVGKALMELDKTRLDLLTKNPRDTNGAYGDAGRPATPRERYSMKMPDDEKSKIWAAMQDGEGCGAPSMENPNFRSRTMDGRCNDFYNPAMGAVGERFPRNVSFEAANKAFADFGEAGKGPRGLNDPNPREVSELLLKRQDPFQYQPAPFFNLWAGVWIQFMTHDWFSHADNGKNDNQRTMTVSEKNIPAEDRVGSNGTWIISSTFKDSGRFRSQATGERPSRTSQNQVSHWWDGSQIYGWNAESRARVIDPRDPAKLLLDNRGLLPLARLPDGLPSAETAAFFDNWWIGLSLLHTTFAREHNRLVDMLRDPANRARAVPPSGASEWSDQEAFDVARLAISALIAKIHTIEWTPQLLFNHIGDKAMNSNWNGLIGDTKNPSGSSDRKIVYEAKSLAKEAMSKLLDSIDSERREAFVAIGAGVSGITSLKRQEHFGSPFALPEEFSAVYRLHSLIPDFIEIYDADAASRGQFRALTASELQSRLPSISLVPESPQRSTYWWRPEGAPAGNMIAIADTLRERSYPLVRALGMDDIAMTFGVTPVGQLTLGNTPKFMTELAVPLAPGGKIDLAAMDIIRDRERGIPRYNKFREELQLKPLKSFDDFVDSELLWEITNRKGRDYPVRSLTEEEVAAKRAALDKQLEFVAKLRSIYKSIDDVDLIVGMQAEFARPHGYAISETQFQVFILNASRRLFSDRFFNQAYTPAFYTQLGYDYVNSTTMADIIRRQYPKLTRALNGVENAFEMWNRERVGYNLSPKQKADFLR